MENPWGEKRENIRIKEYFFTKPRTSVELASLITKLVKAARTAHVEVYNGKSKDRTNLAFMLYKGAQPSDVEQLYAFWDSSGEE